MSPERPASVRWIVRLAWLRLAFAALSIALAISFVTPFDAPFLEGMRQGWLGHTRFAQGTYGYGEAGQIAGRALWPAVLAACLLIFVRWRRLIGLRIAALLGVLLSLTAPLALVINVPIVVLAFMGTTRAYLRRASGPSGPMA